MDEVKRTYRDVETNVKKTARDVDGTDLKDRVGNAGDEAGKDLEVLQPDETPEVHRSWPIPRHSCAQDGSFRGVATWMDERGDRSWE